jgi:hypothetical protein
MLDRLPGAARPLGKPKKRMKRMNSINSMRLPIAGWTGRGGPWALAVVVLFAPMKSYSAYDAQPEVQEVTEPAAPPQAEPEAGVEPVAARPAPAPSEDNKATKKIPKRLLRPLLGCWQLDGQERWIISRLDVSGLQVVTKLIHGSKRHPGRPSFPDYARRAAVPSTLMYDAQQGNFGFSVAARSHTTLVVFRQSGSILEASLYSRHSRKDRYTFTGNSATLEHCKAFARGRSPSSRPPIVPPRLR